MKLTSCTRLFLAAFCLSLLTAGWAGAVTIDLVAEQVAMTMPDGQSVPMWRFRETTDPLSGAVTVPGPTIRATAGDTLTINLTNDLPVPVSLVINGQAATEAGAMVPTWTDNSTGARPGPTSRVRSFTHEVAPAATATYSWGPLREGTFLLQSGTDQAVQLPMGLYLAVAVETGAGEPYPGQTVSQDVTLLFSEVDPALNNAVAGPSPTYGTAAYPTSLAVGYQPRYFLINGAPFPGSSPIAAGAAEAADPVILRFLNAGMRSRMALVQDSYVDLIAYDGNLLPHSATQYSVDLQPGGTVDALLTAPATAAYLPVYDRMLGLTNGGESGGGMLTYLAFAPAAPGATFDLAVTTSGNGAGIVASLGVPGGIACGTDCSETYPENTAVELEANPAAGSVFTGWSGDCTGTGICGLTMTANAAVDAAFMLAIQRIGAVEAGNWYLDANNTGAWEGTAGGDSYAFFNVPGGIPVAGDWNGDGLSEVGMYLNGDWQLDLNGNGQWDGAGTDREVTGFGSAAMLPVVGDWDGDGRDEIGTYNAGNWRLDVNGNGTWDGAANGDRVRVFGTSGMVPVVGNWDGVGRDEIGAFENGIWYLDLNGNGSWNGTAGGDASHAFGTGSMTPVTGDWNNDGSDDIGAYENGMWYLDLNGSGSWEDTGGGDALHSFGSGSMTPVTGLWH